MSEIKHERWEDIEETPDIFLHLHLSNLADAFVQSDLEWQIQSIYYAAETCVHKILPTLPNYRVHVQLPTNGIEL